MLAKSLPEGTGLELQFLGAPAQQVGHGVVKFRVIAKNARTVYALKSLHEIWIGEAYLLGELDLEGDLVAALDLRSSLTDLRLLAFPWPTYGQPLVYGQTARDKHCISERYAISILPSFLEKQFRCYSHGYFEREDEPLQSAIERKLTCHLVCHSAPYGPCLTSARAGERSPSSPASVART